MGWKNATGWSSADGWGMAPVATGGGKLFEFSFLTNTSLPAELSLSRTTAGTYFNGSGIHSDAAIDAARFEHEYNGSSWIASGLLVESQSTNVCQNSNDFSSGGWFWHAVGGTPNGDTGPDGVAAVIPVVASQVSGSGIHNNSTIGIANRMSFFAKTPATISGGATLQKTYLNPSLGGSSPDAGVTFDPATGATTQVRNATGSSVDVANGWRRYTLVRNAGNTTSGDLLVLSYSDINNPTMGNYYFGYILTSGSGSSAYGPDLYEVQAEINTYTSSLIRNHGGSSTTRGADILSSNSPLTGYLSAGPSVWELTDLVTGTVSRTSFAAGTFTFPADKLYRSFAVYSPGFDTSPYLTVGGPY